MSEEWVYIHSDSVDVNLLVKSPAKWGHIFVDAEAKSLGVLQVFDMYVN